MVRIHDAQMKLFLIATSIVVISILRFTHHFLEQVQAEDLGGIALADRDAAKVVTAAQSTSVGTYAVVKGAAPSVNLAAGPAANRELPSANSALSQIAKEPVVPRSFNSYKREYTSEQQQEMYLKEVEKDPHGIPASLHEVANKMAVDMEKAKASKQDAIFVFNKLARCATAAPEAELNFVRAACAQNARTFALKYPKELKVRYQQMMEEVTSEVRNIISH